MHIAAIFDLLDLSVLFLFVLDADASVHIVFPPDITCTAERAVNSDYLSVCISQYLAW